MGDYEAGLEHLKQLIGCVSETGATGTMNEANTRFHLIDRLIEDVLQWPRASTKVEVRFQGTYSDYEIGSPATTLLIEAKREGTHFQLPSGWSKNVAQLPTLSAQGQLIAEAVNQAMGYAQCRGIPVAAVCSGHQLLAFLASRQDGVPPSQGKTIVFRSLEDMRDSFRLLWDCLSPDGMKQGHLVRILAVGTLPAPCEKIARSIPGYPGYKNRNPIATELQILGGLFLEDIVRSPQVEDDFLKQTYCKSGALSQYALVSKELLRKRDTVAFERATGVSSAPATDKKGTSEELRSDLIAASLSRRPILLVGDVGVGKTMFIRHLIRIDAAEELERAAVLYIDFGAKPAVAEDLRKYVVAEMRRQLLEDCGIDVFERNFVRGVYHGELRRFESSVWGDLKSSDESMYRRKEIEHLEQLMEDDEQHLKACIGHLARGEGRRVVVFLDNVDQRSSTFQEEVFLIAQALAESWPVTTFVSLRPETFARSRVAGSLAAYQPRVFTIDPPRMDEVVARRIEFAKKMLEDKGRLPSFPAGLTVQLESLHKYLDMLLRAFSERPDIIEFVDNMSGGNVRRALDFVASFIGSGHVASQKILTLIDGQGYYTLPLHEFLRAVMMGDGEHYDPAKSPVVNVFDTSTHDRREHFLLPIVVSYVERSGQLGGADGYVELDAVYAYAQALGFHPQQIEAAIRRSLERQLLRAPVGLRGDDGGRVRITTVGAYTVKRLPSLFAYVDAVIVDTPIMDVASRSLAVVGQTVDERLARTRQFASYLSQSWGTLTCDVWRWSEHAGRLEAQMVQIESRLRGARGA